VEEEPNQRLQFHPTSWLQLLSYVYPALVNGHTGLTTFQGGFIDHLIGIALFIALAALAGGSRGGRLESAAYAAASA
jgi:hypothetical protein